MNIEVSQVELVSHQGWYLDSKQRMLSILKAKGAPVSGVIWFTPDFENYSWHSYYDERDQVLRFQIKEVENA